MTARTYRTTIAAIRLGDKCASVRGNSRKRGLLRAAWAAGTLALTTGILTAAVELSGAAYPTGMHGKVLPPVPAGCPCTPNARYFGYFESGWRAWPDQPRPDKDFPSSIGREQLPTPSPSMIEPLPTPEAMPLKPPVEPRESILPPGGVDIEGGGGILPPSQPRGGVPRERPLPSEQPLPGEVLPPGGMPGLPLEPRPQPTIPSQGIPGLPMDPTSSAPRGAWPADQAWQPQPQPLTQPAPVQAVNTWPSEPPVNPQPPVANLTQPEWRKTATVSADRYATAGDLTNGVAARLETASRPMTAVKILEYNADEQVAKPAASTELRVQQGTPFTAQREAIAEPQADAAIAPIQPVMPDFDRPTAPSFVTQPVQATAFVAPMPAASADAPVATPWSTPKPPSFAPPAEPTPSAVQNPVYQQNENHVDTAVHAASMVDSTEPAMEGFCPVTLGKCESWQPGESRWSVKYHGATYYTAGPVERECFLVEPERYVPACDGDDPVLAVEEGRHAPGVIDHCVTFDGRLYLFTSDATLAQFRANPRRYTGLSTSR